MKKIRLLTLRCALVITGFAACFGYTACQQEKPQQEQESVAQSPQPKSLEDTLLTKDNAVSVLTKYAAQNPDSVVEIITRHGNIKIKLFQDTPLHRANFIRHTKRGFYDQGEFFRVEKDFMIQGGDSDKRTMDLGRYNIPAEIKPHYFHKKGAVGMACYGDEKNPERASSSHHFYIVQGQPLSKEEVMAHEQQKGIKYTPDQVKTYTTLGGAPSLDQAYTIFGEVIEGLDVVDKIAAEPVDAQNWPRQPVKMQVKVVQ
ncbi:MAG: peptidylprolyl isomerase [Hymenobacteraceae bacterium]|nr:peptidylprolyl isomerase [Hymenobacteraceae bacterium]MDX5396727.1 peptidylprolyl isomerase [Hymenobacteraceae bacterium]MDX5442317.1 peptidylprolyl isomerase [Hymenobacteraceae bacterium]MDX5512787.1 peptidylprolyl isomerase [Hymenobacteraceae bacterium]